MKALNKNVKYPAKILLLSVLYIISGGLGLALAVPPGYATLIWPPSGIALGMLIVHGWRLWPGVLIGSFFLNAYISGTYSAADGIIFAKMLTAFAIAAGSTLQALAGRLLVQLYVGLPLRLNHIREVVCLFVMAGPVACLIAASFGTGALYMAGILPGVDVLSNWLAWWGGDVFGIIVFLPLVLIAPGSAHRLKWRNNVASGLPPAIMCAVLTLLGLTFYTWKITAESAYQESFKTFKGLATENEKALMGRLNAYENALRGGVGFFQGADQVLRQQWRDYVDALALKKNLPGINGVGWIKPVEPENLTSYLAQVRADGAPDFNIHPQAAGKPNFIITYIEPALDNRQALGLNIAFEANRLEAAINARDTGQPTITKPIVLVQDAQKTSGFLLLYPFYLKDRPLNTVEERQDAFLGWIYAPFVAKNFLHELTKSQGYYLNLRIYDGETESPDALIYGDASGGGNGKPVYIFRKTIEVMQRKWLVVWDSTLSFEHAEKNDLSIFILVGGVLLSGLFSLAVVVISIRRTETMEWLAGDRKFTLPLVIFGFISLGAYALHDVMREKEIQYARKLVEDETRKMELLLDSQAQDKLLALKRMAQRWEVAGGTPLPLWENDARNYTSQLSGLRTVEWVDSTYHIRRVEPLEGNQKAVGLNILFDKQREEILKGAAERQSPTLTPPLDLIQGYHGFIAYFPLWVNNAFDGFIVGIFAIDDFFHQALTEEIQENFSLSMLYAGKPYFTNKIEDELQDETWISERTLQLQDQKWTIRLIPTQKFVAQQQTALPNIILIAGIIIALLSALSVRYIIISRLRSEYLRKSNQLNSAILSSSAYLIIATDYKGQVVTFNKAAEKALGYSAEEIVGTRTPAIWHDGQEVATRAAELSEELGRPILPGFRVFVEKAHLEGVESREWTFIRKDGSRFPVNLTVTPMRGKNGRVTGYLGVVEDVTERRRQQQALKTSEETFRSAMEDASIGMALVQPDGRWLKVNQALCDLLGYSGEELLANDFQSLTHPEDLEQDLDYIRQMVAGDIQTYQLEKRYHHKSGRIIWALLSASLVHDAHGAPNYFIAQIQDITERKEMERIKSEFISVVSHELRTPLTSIRGSLGLILGALSKGLPEKVKNLLSIAHNNCGRLILLVNDILDIDKIAAGQMQFDMKEEALGPLTSQAVEANQAYAQKFQTTIAWDGKDDGIAINIDAPRYIQVLSNLLSNAAKFSPPGEPVQIFTSVQGAWVRISIVDKGPGIPEEFQTRIFGKFTQADSSATRTQGGTGLGLHISKELVEHMGGRIGFDTEIGKGATFWVEFPVSSQGRTGQLRSVAVGE